MCLCIVGRLLGWLANDVVVAGTNDEACSSDLSSVNPLQSRLWVCALQPARPGPASPQVAFVCLHSEVWVGSEAEGNSNRHEDLHWGGAG